MCGSIQLSPSLAINNTIGVNITAFGRKRKLFFSAIQLSRFSLRMSSFFAYFQVGKSAFYALCSVTIKWNSDDSAASFQCSARLIRSAKLYAFCLFVKAPVTPGLRPGYDLPATEKWVNRSNNVRLVAEVVRLVAEVVGDRKGQISHNKVVVMFKTRSHRAYDQVTTYLRSKNVGMMIQS